VIKNHVLDAYCPYLACAIKHSDKKKKHAMLENR